MTTPYDTALRARQREVDALRTAIGAAADRASQAQAKRREASDAIARETALAATLHLAFPVHAYRARARAERDELVELCAAADAALDALRSQAGESYGALRVLEDAVDGFRQEADRTAASAEQAGIDDIAGARFARAARRPRVTGGGNA